jgi:transcriptional regulator with GAF, ATPase, and Fis domain
MQFRFGLERGERLESRTVPMSSFAARLIEARQPIVINEDLPGWLAERDLEVAVVGELPKSMVFAPLVAGDQVRGAISIQNVDREDAFPEANVRLLTTLASSLSVALENARLFDETRRLLAETDRRAAELAIVNNVQRALAAELDVQAMYDLVGAMPAQCSLPTASSEGFDSRTSRARSSGSASGSWRQASRSW